MTSSSILGAVIGRDFSYALLRVVAGMEDAPLQLALDRLVEADILLVQGLAPNSDYRFKHALIQDAAYENLLKSRRQALHRRIAETLHVAWPGKSRSSHRLRIQLKRKRISSVRSRLLARSKRSPGNCAPQ